MKLFQICKNYFVFLGGVHVFRVYSGTSVF